MKGKILVTVLALFVVLSAVPAPAAAADIRESTYTTESDFQSGTLNGLQVSSNGYVTTAPESVSASNVNNDGDWTVVNDQNGFFSSGSPALYSPGRNLIDQYVRYNGFDSNGRTGTLKITGDFEPFDFSDGGTPRAGPVMIEDDGDFYIMAMIDADRSGSWRLGRGTVGDGEGINWYGSGFGDFNDFGGPADIEMTFNHDTHTLCGEVFGPIGGSECVNTGGDPSKVGVSGGSAGSDELEFENMDASAETDTGGTYTSAAHQVENPSKVELDLELTDGTADYTIHDGNGNTLGSATYSSGGTKTINLDALQQVGSEVYVEVDATADAGESMTFRHKEERVYYANAVPQAENLIPSGGEIIRTETPYLEFDVLDDNFDEVQGDSVTATVYTSYTGKVNTYGPYTSEETVGIQFGTTKFPDGDYDWHVVLEDEHGETWTSQDHQFTVKHYEPVLDDSSAYPDGVTVDTAEQELSIDVSDADFAHDGDELTVEFYRNGSRINTQTVTSNGTVSYQMGALEDGDYQWHAEVSDDWGNSDVSDTFYFTIQHGPTEITNVQPADGTITEYETNTFSADVSDPDFENEGGGGDTVDVRFYVDGTLRHEESITSSQTVDADLGPLADGDHDWYIETEDKYGYTETTSTRTITVQHNDPVLTSASPSGTVEYEDQALSVDVDDGDFTKDGDSVTVDFTLDGNHVGSETLTSAGTASVNVGPLEDGTYSWSASAEDEYGRTDSASDSFTVEHHDPVLSSPGPTGTFDNSEPTLSVVVDDEDFTKDGDEVAVDFFIDGAKVGSDTVTQDATLAELQVGPLEDGTYEARMEATDAYGRTDETANFTFTVEHHDPVLSNAAPTGTVHYEENTLSVDLADGDFSGEGDTVDLEFTFDGNVVSTQTVGSAGTYTADVGPTPDGSYTWRVDATDSYDRTGTTGDQTVTIQHDDPDVGSPSPDGQTRYEKNTLEVDVADADFARDGDSVDVEFYVDGELQATKTATSNTTLTYTTDAYADGEHDWHVEWEDDYGHSGSSPTWSLDIQHSAPVVGGMVDPGTTNRENVDLTVNVQDDDFSRDGDTVDVEFYVDGELLTTKTTHSAGDVTATTGELADGSHSWSATLSDRYGYSTDSQVQSFEVVHHAPVVDDTSLEPTEGTTLTNYTATFKANVTDGDFADPTADENVTARLYVEGELQGTTHLSSNGTAVLEVVPGFGGDVTYHWEFEDKYGYTERSKDVNITSPGSLEMYNELAPETALTADGEASFYFQYENDRDEVVTRNVTTGSVDMGGLPTAKSFVVVARVDGYYNRRVWVPSLFESDRMYLIPDDADVVRQGFQLKDYTGDYPLDETVLEVERAIDGEWRTVDGDFFGADDELTSILEYNARYRLILRNTESGQTRELGTLFPVAEDTVELRVLDEGTELFQAGVPAPEFSPDADSLPAAQGTTVTAGLDPRDSDTAEYTVVASAGGEEVYNQTHDVTEDAKITMDLRNKADETVTVNTTYEVDGSNVTSSRSWRVGGQFSGGDEGLVAGASDMLDAMGDDLGGLVAVLVSGLAVAFTSSRVGPRTSGTIALMALAGFTLLGFMTSGWLAVAATAYLTLLGARWYA
jgi:hypothetical protein